ncbi:MAG TPA: carboxypeptidase regulatory-like domain-containing protein [Candidatus Cybelea sp.]|nr:carboxypeptidase regulatory-like domain-containing protein [Candidatus Cybelea sp.]
MKSLCLAFRTLLFLGFLGLAASAALAQDTASLTGTVTDVSGGVIAGAEVSVTNAALGINRTTAANADGNWLVSGLPIGSYDLKITAKGFKTFEARGVVLRVGQKARVDASLTVGEVSAEVVVAGENVAQVDTQSSQISGTITSTELSQLQLNGRNFTQLITLTPGVNNQTGQDEGTVGVYGNVSYSVNGGRVEYNNWEIDGGDNMDNGSNDTLNVYPSIDAIQEVTVMTSNYGAQYGRNASGTIEAETKSGTSSFHGDVYEFNRNNMFNDRSYFDESSPNAPEYKKNDFGYTLGGPIYIPNHYNTEKSKTFFFWSQEWRLERVPNTFEIPVPSVAERGGNFSDVCAVDPTDCPSGPGIVNNQVQTIDPNASAILAEIPPPNCCTAPVDPCASVIFSCYDTSSPTPTYWREELVRVDHNFTSKLRGTFRYIHDSWNTVTEPTLWSSASLPTIQTKFIGPGTSAVARLTATASPTLMNEFVMSYTADHIFLTDQGPWQRPASMTMGGLFNNGFGGKLPGVSVYGNDVYSFAADPSDEPWNNANPTYTLRDNLTKVIGKHNLQMGVYAVAAEKNEDSGGENGGFLTFTTPSNGSVYSTGNAFADLLIGNVDAFSQANTILKYYNRYKIVEPYLQDDFHVTSRLTLNLGLRVSLFGTYHEKYNREFSWEASKWVAANAPGVDPDGSITGTAGLLYNPATGMALSPTSPQVFNGIEECGGTGVVGSLTLPTGPRSCLQGHLFNPAPRIGFAWDPWGNGKSSIRGGYGIFFEHQNGNESNTESLEGTPPLVLTESQGSVAFGAPGCAGPSGYECVGAGGGQAFPLSPVSIPTQALWPYSQQWNLDIQHEFFRNVIGSIAYVGSKGTHLALQRDLNQLQPTPASENPYTPGVPLTSSDCTNLVANGTPVSSLPQSVQNNFNIACGNVLTDDPYRPFLGISTITGLQNEANSNYNSLQVSVRRTIAPLTLDVAYTYSHSLDDSSDRYDGNFVNSYNLRQTYATSNFDETHILDFSYVYNLPSFRSGGFKNAVLGGWEYSGITTFYTGTPFSVTNGEFTDNAGVANGVGTGSFVDRVPGVNPYSSIPSLPLATGSGPLLINPNAFTAPEGLTFGDSGRNFLRSPLRLNFDMALFKNFKIKESMAVQFRAEAFNVFNHTEWSGVNSGVTCYGAAAPYSPTDASCVNAAATPELYWYGFGQPSGAHLGRIMQFGLKFLF